MDRPLTVLYILGAGHSGSTVLDAILGNHRAIVNVGELEKAYHAWSSTKARCACGARAGQCPFWKRVRSEWRRTAVYSSAAVDWRQLRAQYETFSLRSLLGVQLDARFNSPPFKRYAYHTNALYHAIANQSGASIIVDSSKNPVRAMALSRVKNLDVKFVHLVRDGRGVAWSLKKKRRPVWRSTQFWLLVNGLSESVRPRAHRGGYVQVRYEDLVTNPEAPLGHIAKLVGLDFDPLLKMIYQGEQLRVGHTIGGNRLRMKRWIKLERDEEWRQALNRRDRQTFWRLAGSMARRYGYVKEG